MYETIGRDTEKQNFIIQSLMESINELTALALDGTLINNESIINNFSHVSYKGKNNGYLDQRSELILYNLETMEPVCSQTYPGNFPDGAVFYNFFESRNITKGLIVADKAFFPSVFKKIRLEKPNIHFLVPLKRNDSKIKSLNLNKFIGEFDIHHGKVLYSKVQYIDEDMQPYFLYHFLDVTRSQQELISFCNNSRKKGKFDNEEFNKQKDKYGTITLESDLDLDPIYAYELFLGRWPIEVFFKGRKSDLLFNITNVQNNFSVRGRDLIELLSSIVYSRLIKLMEKTKLKDKMSFSNMMFDLRAVTRKAFTCDQIEEIPFSNDKNWAVTSQEVYELLETLSLSKPVEIMEKRGRGRPKGSKNKKTIVMYFNHFRDNEGVKIHPQMHPFTVRPKLNFIRYE